MDGSRIRAGCDTVSLTVPSEIQNWGRLAKSKMLDDFGEAAAAAIIKAQERAVPAMGLPSKYPPTHAGRQQRRPLDLLNIEDLPERYTALNFLFPKEKPRSLRMILSQ